MEDAISWERKFQRILPLVKLNGATNFLNCVMGILKKCWMVQPDRLILYAENNLATPQVPPQNMGMRGAVVDWG